MELIDLKNENYPNKLKQIKKPPKKIYIEGNIQNLNLPYCIGVIGSRNNTSYGEKWCKFFVKEFVRYGMVIVSGMAVGIDSIAHKEAIENGGRTIAVIPSGLNNIYPKVNKNLYKLIINNGGTVITEYEPYEEASSKRFIERNRIVSGLSDGVFVVEASYRSGTSVTAKIALEQNKKVFCIPRKFG